MATLFWLQSEIFDEFLGENSAEAMGPLLDKVIRIRAVQDFSPSSSLAFIFDLKKIARGVLEEEMAAGEVSREELSDFDQGWTAWPCLPSTSICAAVKIFSK